MTHAPATLTIVDGFNVLHAVVLRGRDRANWRRAQNQTKVADLVRGYAEGRVLLVFDGEALSGGPAPSQHVEIAYAPHADDYIVERVRMLTEQEPRASVQVVSADRALLDRAGRFGARRLSPWRFAELCGSQP